MDENNLSQTNALLSQLVAAQKNPWLPLRNGILAGLGGAIGASVIFTLLLNLLKPFEELKPVGSALQKIAQQNERRK